ncbi:hypothetical protein [Mycolicibacterium sp. CR10]|uniref:hypothetical protein n=1 Tax=Mycolicibacterium sp. CR10 TaxID=2562314 RepID=UPI0010BFC1CD|nr:hypothetical protein [Mycolicibacterium sp. CR10]
MSDLLPDDPQNPDTWVRKAKRDLARARVLAFQQRHVEEGQAMRSAGIASLLAARRTRDRGGELTPLWGEALAHDNEVEPWLELDPLQSDYYREQSIHLALLAAIDLEKE